MQIRWRTGRGPGGVHWGEIELPDKLGHKVTVRATANEKDKAVARSASIAEKALNSPELQALLPPGAGPALKVASKMLRSKAARKAFSAVRKFF